MNRGEWGEPYAALSILGDQKLYTTDDKGILDPNEWMDVLRVVRKETESRTVVYHCNNDNIDVEVNGCPVKSIKAVRFKHFADQLKQDISVGSGRSFNVSDDVQDFLVEAEILHRKAKSVEKSDIFLDARDPRSSIVRENIGFSIKCEFGESPTLFNTAKASAAKYRIVGMDPRSKDYINSLVDNKGHAAVSDRCEAIKNMGCRMEFVGFEIASRAKCEAFKENLEIINPLLPAVIDKILRNHFMERQTDIGIDAVMQRIIKENPCKISRPEIKYPYMMKAFLYAAFCGMTASTLWDGKSTVKGGYITIKNSGEVVANYAMESEAFKNYLYTHCYLDFPSTDYAHGAYGEVEEKNGEYYFKLNFQVRIK